MKKYKIFIYDDAKPHAHDQDPVYENTVPLSNIGIKKHFDVKRLEGFYEFKH